jgi:hypothetical protein
MQNPAKTILLPRFKRAVFLKVPGTGTRLAILACLAILLFLVGFYTEFLFGFLTRGFDMLFLDAGSYGFLPEKGLAVSRLITRRSFPVMLLYGAVYTALSFVFLHVYFRSKKTSLLAAGFYGVVFLGCLLLMGTGKFFPELTAASRLARRLIEFIVSPFPIVLLIAAFRAFPNRKADNRTESGA